ncbi:MAG: VOC family protein [Thermoplasmata archaeon]|nr:VOC family protein [Thermoplasmata archaeon]
MFLDYAGIRVTDLERSVRFYRKALGLKELRRGSTDGLGTWVLLEDPLSKQKLELNYYVPASPFATPFVVGEGLDHLGFRVPDPRRTAAKMLKLGAKAGPKEASSPDGGLLYLLDPDGLWIELIQTPAADARRILPKARRTSARGRSKRTRAR